MGRTSDARERLIEAVLELIWEYSYGAVTIDAICERAKVRKGSFYYFFASKSELALTAIDVWWAERQKIHQEVFNENNPPLERIKAAFNIAVVRQMNVYEKSGQILGCPIFILGAEICTQDEKLRDRIQMMLSSMRGYFEQAIQEAHLLGEIEAPDAQAKARALFSFYEGMLGQARIENNPDLLRDFGQQALDLLGAKSHKMALA